MAKQLKTFAASCKSIFFKAKQASAVAVCCNAIFTASNDCFPGIRTDCADSVYFASTVLPWGVPPTSAAGCLNSIRTIVTLLLHEEQAPSTIMSLLLKRINWEVNCTPNWSRKKCQRVEQVKLNKEETGRTAAPTSENCNRWPS